MSLNTGDASFLLFAEYACVDSKAAEKAKNYLKSACEWQLNNFVGVNTYLMMEQSPTEFVFCEVYKNKAAFWDHAKDENVAKDLQAMFQDDIRKSASTKCLAFGTLDEGISSTMKALNFPILEPLCGFLEHPLKSSDIRKDGATIVETDFAVIELTGIESLARVVHLLETPIKMFASERMYAASIHTLACGKINDSSVMLLCITEKGFLMSVLKSLICTKELRILKFQEKIIRLMASSEQDLSSLREYKFEIRSLSKFAGYGRHPVLASKSNDSSGATAVNSNEVFNLIRNKFTDVAEVFEFSKALAPNDSLRPKNENVLTIALLHVIRKFLNSGHLELKLSVSRCFGALSRLRKLREDVKKYNELIGINNKNISAADQLFLERFLTQVSLFGYGLKTATLKVEIQCLNEFITAIEKEYASTISETRESLKANNAIPYLGLQEYYQIGMFVKMKASSLGGVECGFRIVDAYFEPLKSLFGGERFSFHMQLESVLFVGGSFRFLFVTFEEVVADWKESKPVSSLDFVPITEMEMKKFSERGKLLQSLTDIPSYKNYAERSFFPARIGGFSNSAASRTTAPGRLMIDVTRGIDAGCTPGGGIGDSPAIAMNATMKAYRGVLRTVTDNESADSKREKLALGGLSSITQIPDDLTPIAWPGLVGFSFDAKTWGTVIADGLSDMIYDETAFDQLVLDPDTKELLLALLKPKHPSSSTLEQFKGILGSHTSNGLVFLLHGAPGTGKSLTVQALAEIMHVPLYVVSFGELGSSVTDLETRIGEIISLCERWKALILLDEGDALLEKRQTSQYALNAMTGVLLRALDTFPGHMFITSNRVNAFDEAVLSRLTLAIQYKPLDRVGRQAIWSNILTRIGCDTKNFNLSHLAVYELSGREVNAVVKLALALAQHRSIPRLDQNTLIAALQVSTNFRKEFGSNEPSKPSFFRKF